MAKTVRWGILGASNFARTQMAPAIHAARRGSLVGLATSAPEKALPFVEMTPGLGVYESYDALLADPDIDAVYIPLPNHLHVSWSLKALEAGKHVLVEKPLAMSAAAFAPVIAARDDTGLLAAEAYMIVFHPQWQRARDLVQAGEIGGLRRVTGTFTYDNRSDAGNIRNKPETGGGGVPDIGVYIYGATRFVTGEEPVAITKVDIARENGVDVYAEICAQFPSFSYTGLVSMRMSPYQEMTFHGDKGILRLTAPFNPLVYGPARIELHQPGATGGPSVTELRFPGDNHYVNQVEAFNLSVLDGRPYPCPLEFSQGTQAMIDQVFAAEGQEA